MMMSYIFSRFAWNAVMPFIICVAMVMPVGGTYLAHADGAGLKLTDAINIAGRQRMLTQRIMKFYCMVGLGVQKEVSVKELQKSLSLFNKQLDQLKNIQGIEQSLINKHLQAIQSEWQTVESLAGASPTANRAPELRFKTNALLIASHNFVQALEASKVSPASKLVNIAGRQRMLSQRIASFYMERVWRVKNKNLANELAGAISDFNFALDTLLNAEQNTSEITSLLAKVEGQWHAFTAINKLRNLAYAEPEMVSESAESILTLMNKVTGLYAGL